MITWANFVVIQERNQDLQRRGEKERFIRQMLAASREDHQIGRPRKLWIVSGSILPMQLQKIIDLAG